MWTAISSSCPDARMRRTRGDQASIATSSSHSTGRSGRRSVPAVEVDQPGVDLAVSVRRLRDAGAGPRGVEELRNAVGTAARVLGVRVPAALPAPEVLETGE